VPSLALIINTFNQPDYLTRVLRGVASQKSLPEEVLIADDGSGDDTRKLLKEWPGAGTLQALHIWQEHQGFRRARVLNEAIARARSEYVVFLDGDTVPHPGFVADHRQFARSGSFVQGHRALLKQEGASWFGMDDFSKDRRRALLRGQLEGWKHAFRWPVPMLRTRADLHGIRGCNLAIWRADLVLVNGYNEAFVGWGREDSELAVRLMNAGRTRLDLRGRALCYHLWHPPANRGRLQKNDELLAEAQTKKSTLAERGLSDHLPVKL